MEIITHIKCEHRRVFNQYLVLVNHFCEQGCQNIAPNRCGIMGLHSLGCPTTVYTLAPNLSAKYTGMGVEHSLEVTKIYIHAQSLY